MDELGLELNSKTGIFPLRNGIDFLGFHSYLTEEGGVIQKLRRDSIERMKTKIRIWQRDYPLGKITKEEIIVSFTAWDAHAAHGDTYSLRTKYAKQVSAIIGEEIRPRRKIVSCEKARDMRKAKAAMQQYRKIKMAQEKSCAISCTCRPDSIPPWQ